MLKAGLAVLNLRFQQGVYRRVHPTHEEGGHRGYFAGVSARFNQVFQACGVCFSNEAIRVQIEQQRHVDVDPMTDELLNGRNALRRGWHLHHDVGAVKLREQPKRFGNSAICIMGQRGADFQRGIAVNSFGGVVDGP